MSTKPIIINTPENTIQSDAQDWASIFNSIIGDVSGVLDYGKKLELKKIDDNTVQLQDGVYSMQGHIIKVDKNNTQNLTITSGTLGMNRLDAVVVEYEKSLDEKKNDTFEFKVIRGTPVNQGGSSPVLPQLVTQDLLSGGSKRQELLYSVLVESTEIKELSSVHNIISNVNDIQTEVKDTSSKVKDLLVKIGLIADYVIETGENEYGQYTKWSSGKYECIFEGSSSVNGNTTTTLNFTNSLMEKSINSNGKTSVIATIRTASIDAAKFIVRRSFQSNKNASVTLTNEENVSQNVFIIFTVISRWK